MSVVPQALKENTEEFEVEKCFAKVNHCLLMKNNKNDIRCRDVKTQDICKQDGWQHEQD